MTDTIKTRYPARYYASFDTKAPSPTAVTGWYDVWAMGSTADVPPADAMIALTAEQWEKRQSLGFGVKNGTLVAYTPPPYVPPLKERAGSAMQRVQQQASMASAMHEGFGPKMQDYVKALRAILDGSDTTSTKLPDMPSDPTT